MNEFYIAITGKTNIESPLDVDKEYPVIFENIGIYGKDTRSNEDGSKKITFKGNAIGQVKIMNGKDIIKGKPKKGSQSQVLRSRIMELYEEKYYTEYSDFETFYISTMSEIIEKIEKYVK